MLTLNVTVTRNVLTSNMTNSRSLFVIQICTVYIATTSKWANVFSSSDFCIESYISCSIFMPPYHDISEWLTSILQTHFLQKPCWWHVYVIERTFMFREKEVLVTNICRRESCSYQFSSFEPSGFGPTCFTVRLRSSSLFWRVFSLNRISFWIWTFELLKKGCSHKLLILLYHDISTNLKCVNLLF